MECPVCGHRVYNVKAGEEGEYQYRNIADLWFCPEHGLFQYLDGTLFMVIIQLPDAIGIPTGPDG